MDVSLLEKENPFFTKSTAIELANIHISEKDCYDKLYEVLENKYKPLIIIDNNLFDNYLNFFSNINKPFILTIISSNNASSCLDNLKGNDLDFVKLLNNDNMIVMFCSQKKHTHHKISSYPIGPLRVTKHIEKFDAKCKFFETHKRNFLFYDFTQDDDSTDYLFNTYDRVDTSSMTDIEYYTVLETYKFCAISPSQQQQHQVWEALLVGTIPIILSSGSNDLYINLPVIIIHNWFTITPEYLENMYIELTNYNNYEYEKLYKFYWLNNIIKYKNK